jgi:hypothetical protein
VGILTQDNNIDNENPLLFANYICLVLAIVDRVCIHIHNTNFQLGFVNLINSFLDYEGRDRIINSYVEIQQEDPSENYAPTLGWSLRLFLGGSLFLDDEQILFIVGEQILFIDVCRLLLSLNNSWTININLFSVSTWK